MPVVPGTLEVLVLKAALVLESIMVPRLDRHAVGAGRAGAPDDQGR